MATHIESAMRFPREASPTPQTAARAAVHIVSLDDSVQASLRRSLCGIDAEPCIHASLQDFLDSQASGRTGCLVIDAQLLGMPSTFPAIRCPIIVTAAGSDITIAVHAMKAGAIDVLEKPPCERRLLQAVVEAIEIDRRRRQAEARLAVMRERFAGLTPRERQVMLLVTAGLLNKLIAADLGLSEITVKAHRGSVMRKMGARSLAELVRMADAIAADGEPRAVRNGSSPRDRIVVDADRRNGCNPVRG